LAIVLLGYARYDSYIYGIIDLKMKTEYNKPQLQEKLNRAQVLEAMSNGAILKKTYGVYSYYSLVFPDGTEHYNIRKGAVEGISRSIKNIVLVSADKNGIVYKWDNY
jgi:hypothetical protein